MDESLRGEVLRWAETYKERKDIKSVLDGGDEWMSDQQRAAHAAVAGSYQFNTNQAPFVGFAIYDQCVENGADPSEVQDWMRYLKYERRDFEEFDDARRNVADSDSEE